MIWFKNYMKYTEMQSEYNLKNQFNNNKKKRVK